MADTIRRTKRTDNFTVVRNEYLQDVNLSWKAKGLITYIMSLPPVSYTHLNHIGGCRRLLDTERQD